MKSNSSLSYSLFLVNFSQKNATTWHKPCGCQEPSYEKIFLLRLSESKSELKEECNKKKRVDKYCTKLQAKHIHKCRVMHFYRCIILSYVCVCSLSWLPPTGLCASSIPSTFVNMGMTGWPTRLSMSRSQRVTDERGDWAPPESGQVPACRIKEPSPWTKNPLLPAWTVPVRTDWFFFLHFFNVFYPYFNYHPDNSTSF